MVSEEETDSGTPNWRPLGRICSEIVNLSSMSVSTSTPFLNHVTLGVGTPSAMQVSVALPPAGSPTAPACAATIDGSAERREITLKFERVYCILHTLTKHN